MEIDTGMGKMITRNTLKNIPRMHQEGVQTLYTEEAMRQYLWHEKLNGKALRSIAKENFDERVTHADIQRGLQGIFPKNPEKRIAFGLATLALAPACPKCGKVHAIYDVCLMEVSVRVVRTRPREYHDLFSIPTAELRRMIEERGEV